MSGVQSMPDGDGIWTWITVTGTNAISGYKSTASAWKANFDSVAMLQSMNDLVEAVSLTTPPEHDCHGDEPKQSDIIVVFVQTLQTRKNRTKKALFKTVRVHRNALP
jgi:hypothetical protein